ncbi:hypothetical protein F0267_24625 [Vibrio coralliilyticus]|uniref:Type III secretion system protein SsaQ n=1 Tax=Vibrio coralliilyticus TaxID=190893 RepID=A0AAN0VXU4_9VIBR|nr:hypothetical protein [Vibrio coralliilyticus]AIW18831.1 hypothetical protein IX92_07135 [Vibrio coralliilyticus]NOH41416.1 hypothetical protein [Vibrio coralliilyticus]
MTDLIEMSKVIGTGLENQQCQMSLQKVAGEGQFWSYRSDSKSGIWCSHSDWNQGVTEITAIESLSMIPEDLFPTLVAAMFSAVSIPFVRDISTQGAECCLLDGIYPVVQCQGYQFVLVGFSAAWLKRLTTHWTHYSGESIKVSVPLVAGYITDIEPISQGNGVWLKEGVDPDEGKAILWWDKPLAIVQFEREQTWSVEQVFVPYSFFQAVSYVQVASLEVDLPTLLQLVEGQTIEGPLTCETACKLVSSNHCITTGELLVSQDGVVFYENNTHPKAA